MSTEITHLKNMGPVRVTIPVSVAYNLSALQAGIRNIMGHLGCPTCHSGVPIDLIIEREYVLNADLKVTAVSDPTPQPWRQMTVSGSPEGIEPLLARVAEVARKTGHPLCCSGFDIALRNELASVE